LDDDTIQAFLEQEKVLREKIALASVESGKVATMKATGTRQRHRRNKKTRVDNDEQAKDNSLSEQNSGSEVEVQSRFQSPKEVAPVNTSPRHVNSSASSRPRPKPRPISKLDWPSLSLDVDEPQISLSSRRSPSGGSRQLPPVQISDDEDAVLNQRPVGNKRKAVIISDDED
jgi:replication fork protection complex subunit Tof1/Swi1